eukprot:TRINITY_DN6418_c0_g1_i3.p1 TRINITY_DN6418_c0_g1~~TRINITY_DN6418_c0_g1_i3.p1  ORF type:complete len:191 (-),score=-17.02 TRINITY_DN6418_c0_g1_i3:17-589(-)
MIVSKKLSSVIVRKEIILLYQEIQVAIKLSLLISITKQQQYSKNFQIKLNVITLGNFTQNSNITQNDVKTTQNFTNQYFSQYLASDHPILVCSSIFHVRSQRYFKQIQNVYQNYQGIHQYSISQEALRQIIWPDFFRFIKDCDLKKITKQQRIAIQLIYILRIYLKLVFLRWFSYIFVCHTFRYSERFTI